MCIPYCCTKIGQSGSVLICGSICFMYKVILDLGAHVVLHFSYSEINHHVFSSSPVMFVFSHFVKIGEPLGSTIKVFFCTSKIQHLYSSNLLSYYHISVYQLLLL